MKWPAVSFVSLLAGLLAAIPGWEALRADELRLDAEALLARGVSRHLCLTSDRRAIVLQRGVVFEDDGPAAGYSYRPNVEALGPSLQIKKTLIIPSPQADSATLLVGPGGELDARINGMPVSLQPAGKQGNYWRAYGFPADVLRPGANEFQLSGTGSVWIARDEDYAAGSLLRQRHPNRSAKSRDGGATWSDTALGTRGDVDGEYYVRVFLDQFQSAGTLTLDVLDLGNLGERPLGPPVDEVGPVRIQAELSGGASESVRIRARTGRTFVPQPDSWSDWSPVSPLDGVLDDPRGRYLQLEVRLSTEDPRHTPRWKGLRISASPRRPADWTSDLRIGAWRNPRIVRSSIPFQYEPFDRPELAELRRRYQLDEVIQGAGTEFEAIQRLAAWSATRWKRMHLKDAYPPYNALEILKPHEDGTPVGGFCQQYNLVFLQACESIGLIGRLVSIGPGNLTDQVRGGHEAVEIWSNEFEKWIYVDGNTAWYAVDERSGVPLSLWEVRERLFAESQGTDTRPIRVVKLAETGYQWSEFMPWARLVELRLIPRSNFLEQRAPLPLNQGMRGWFWTGHYVWTDDRVEPRLLYPNRVCRRENFEWTLNQARLVLEATERPGTLRVHVDTSMPGLAGLYASVDGQPEYRVTVPFDWPLHGGENTLRVRPQNTAGRDGTAASVSVSVADSAQWGQ